MLSKLFLARLIGKWLWLAQKDFKSVALQRF